MSIRSKSKIKSPKIGLRKYNLKLILIGDGGVGKTSLVQQFVSSSFDVDYKITIGVNVMSKVVTLWNGESANLIINDVAGQPRFEVMRQTFYLGAQIVMLVFDLTRKQSLDNLINVWLPELMASNPPKKGLPPMQMLLIGNKVDLEDLRSVDEDEINEAAEKIKKQFTQAHLVGTLETSAKTNIAVDESFTTLANAYIKELKNIYG